MAQENEASVEEILESIKKVIARDNRDGALEARRRREADADEAAERAVVQDNDADENGSESEDVLDLAQLEVAEDAEETLIEQPETLGDAPLIKDETRNAMQENLAALAMLSEPGARPQIVRSGETSLEGLTRELMRPMIAEWLDANLPSMVEEMVQAEIARIAGKKS
ncbi:MAG: DUF2497 domain-containing protein [Erythrobacter sp.]